MQIGAKAIAWAWMAVGVVACSTSPTAGTSSTGTHAGGADAGSCEPREDYLDICGDCKLCLEEKCCVELSACWQLDGCMDCVGNNPNAMNCGVFAVGTVLVCSQKCEVCHTGYVPPCSPFHIPDGGGASDGGGGAGGGGSPH
jgi:hypothetical protein